MHRRIILTTLLAVLTVPAASAQLTFGLKGGFNMAGLSGDETQELNSRFGFAVGGFAEYDLTRQIAIRPELFYSMRGATAGDGEFVSITLAADFIEIPILARYLIATGDGVDIGLLAGPALAFKVNERTSVSGQLGSGSEATNEFSSTDVGLSVGAILGTGPLAIDLRYTHGLTNAASAEYPFREGGESIRHSVLSLTMNYVFGR